MKKVVVAVSVTLVAFTQSTAAMEQGRYEGPADGGWLYVTVQGDTFDIAVANDRGCGGSAKGTLKKAGNNRWSVDITDDDQACKLDILRQGLGRYNIEEKRCSFFHGASCSFSGFVTPKHNSSRAASSYSYVRKFGSYECTNDCSGHKAGFEWAERNDITDEYDCVGNSNSFEEGCTVYIDDPYRAADLDDDGDYIP